jgi:hypothetical protein
MRAFLRKNPSEINIAARRRHKKMIDYHHRNQRTQILISTIAQQLTEL